MSSTHDQLLRAAKHHGSKVALVCDNRRVTYSQLLEASDRVAAHLHQLGVGPGDRVVICLPNSIEAVAALYGTWRLGACIVMVDAESPPAQLAHSVSHSSARALIAHRTRLDAARAALGDEREPPALLLSGEPVDGVRSLDTPAGDPPPVPSIDPDAPAAIIYTTGSTGAPKGVTHSHRSIATVVAAVGEYLEHTADDIVLCILQLAFGYGLLQVLVTFEHGGTVVLRRGFGLPYDLVTTIAVERVTGLAGVPTLFAMLRGLQAQSFAACTSLRYLTCAAAALPPALADEVRAMFPSALLYVMHGQTECFRTTYLPPVDLDARRGSVGRGMPGVDLWLEDEGGRRLPNGGEGELIVRGDNVMLGYWEDPVATAQVIRPGRTEHERILRTRDLFRSDHDGYLWFVSRTDEIIKTRGEKVSPHEIEKLLAELPAIAEARVIGVPHEVFGHTLRAEIVLREGQQLDESEVRRFLHRGLPPHKVPSELVFVDALPKSTSGKVLHSR